VWLQVVATGGTVADNGPVGDDPGGDDQSGVTDDDRQRYGLLLDRAAERGLLDTTEYQHRLGDLASATTIDQMNSIVTELPVFDTPGATTGRHMSPRSTSWSSPAAEGGGSRRWLILVIVVIVVVAAMAFLAVYSHHLVDRRSHGESAPPVPARPVSGPRP